MLISPRQENDYDCGVVAVEYLVELHARAWIASRAPSRGDLASALDATPEEGTSHVAIVAFLREMGLDPKEHVGPIETAPFPCIVNYWDVDDGHYGVIVAKTENQVFLFNPETGGVDTWNIGSFNSVFYSKRYGEKWSCSI